MTPEEFALKWRPMQLKETSSAQQHFLDICAMVDHPTPAAIDPDGEFFTFEASTSKASGNRGRADVWYKNHFIWEYKGPKNRDLTQAYEQLLLYKDDLGNPPLLITSDTHTIFIHTNFTNTVKHVYEISFETLLEGDGLKWLKWAFHEPEKFKPATTQDQATKATADTFVAVAEDLQRWFMVNQAREEKIWENLSEEEKEVRRKAIERSHDAEKAAHFLVRLLFCLFAQDLELLPDKLFTQIVRYPNRTFPQFVESLKTLFTTMKDGGLFGFYPVPYFDGGLFDDDYVPTIPTSLTNSLSRACEQNWADVDPVIFGTLFERVIDESKRTQLGAHYTSENDIMLIVEPVLMAPLREKWRSVRYEAEKKIRHNQPDDAFTLLHDFATNLSQTRVLDPACGSGNFLYTALKQLLSLQKEVIVFADKNSLPQIPLSVSPQQLYGIEINTYAHELAQITVWIGYLQWRNENGFRHVEEPILQPLKNIQHKDAILAYNDQNTPIEPTWPEADVIIGNPPFLGGQLLRGEFGHKFDDIQAIYGDFLPGQSDLVCYWFEKGRAQVEKNFAKRVGLIATNSIRGGSNRTVLQRIKKTGDIFMAWSDRAWILDGAAVRVSIVAFDDGSESRKTLNGQDVNRINSDLTSVVDVTKAEKLANNQGLAFQGPVKVGAFDIEKSLAKKMIRTPNPFGRSNAEVIVPWMNGSDITRRPRGKMIIDFDQMSQEEASNYVQPFEYVKKHIKPKRDNNNSKSRREYWWRLGASATDLREAKVSLKRFIISPRVSKYRLFIWVDSGLLPDSATVAITREDDYFFGVLHAKPHELWALRQGTSLEDRPRYTPTSTFETYPFPWPPGQEPTEADNPHVAAIAQAARDLVNFRQAWLNPPQEDIGVVISKSDLKKRTLTNLYNALTDYREAKADGKRFTETLWRDQVNGIIGLSDIDRLDYIHQRLDEAVLNAYGWPTTLTDDQILERLLTLNLERATPNNN